MAIVGLGFVGWASTALAGEIVEADLNMVNLAVSVSMGVLLALAVYSYSLLASAWCSTQGSALALSTLATFIAYIANVIGSGYEGMSWLADISIFHYYDPVQLMQNAAVDLLNIAVLAGVVLGGHVIALAIFARRDLSV